MSAQQSRMRQVLKILMFVYLAFLLWQTIFRSDFGRYALFTHGDFNMTPFADLKDMYATDRSTFYYLFWGNILIFAPFGFLALPFLGGRGSTGAVVMTVFAGAMLSIVIEISQWAFGVGVTEVDDLILNTAGTLLGALLCLPFRRFFRHYL